MAMTKEEKAEFEALKQRAQAAEEEATEAMRVAEEANLKAAEDAISIANAVAERDAAIKAAADSGGIKRDKSKKMDPTKPPKFNDDDYFAECHGSAIAFAQNGWFFDINKNPIEPVNK